MSDVVEGVLLYKAKVLRWTLMPGDDYICDVYWGGGLIGTVDKYIDGWKPFHNLRPVGSLYDSPEQAAEALVDALQPPYTVHWRLVL